MPGHPGPRLHLRRRQAVPPGSDHRAGLLSACHRFLTYPPQQHRWRDVPAQDARGFHPRGFHPPRIWAIAGPWGLWRSRTPAGCELPLAPRQVRLLVPDPALSWPRATALRARPHSTRYRFPYPGPPEDQRGLSTDRDRARRRRRAGLRPVRGPARLPPCAAFDHVVGAEPCHPPGLEGSLSRADAAPRAVRALWIPRRQHVVALHHRRVDPAPARDRTGVGRTGRRTRSAQ